MSETIHDRIERRLAELGLTPEAASKKAGLSRDYLRKVLARQAMPRHVRELATALEVTPTWLLAVDEASAAAGPRQFTVSAERLPDAAADVPVWGTAAGSHTEGAFQLRAGDAIDYVPRLPGIANARNVYAIYIENDSMWPEHNPGDLRYINPDRPPRPGDSVVVQMQDPDGDVTATIGHFIRRTRLGVTIGKLNPRVEIELDAVREVHKVLTVNELAGV